MPHIAANLSMLFADVPFMDRFQAARAAGFGAVEILFPYEYCLFTMKRKLRDYGLKLVLINLPAGNLRLGDRGIAAHPMRQEEFRAGVETGVRWAQELGAGRLNCVPGVRDERFSLERQMEVLAENIEYAASRLAPYGMQLTLEPLSGDEVPGSLLSSSEQALAVIEQIKADNVYLLLNAHNIQREGGNITTVLREHIRKIGHIQIADSPRWRLLDTVKFTCENILKEMDMLGYTGFASLEYSAVADTLQSLTSLRKQRFVFG